MLLSFNGHRMGRVPAVARTHNLFDEVLLPERWLMNRVWGMTFSVLDRSR